MDPAHRIRVKRRRHGYHGGSGEDFQSGRWTVWLLFRLRKKRDDLNATLTIIAPRAHSAAGLAFCGSRRIAAVGRGWWRSWRPALLALVALAATGCQLSEKRSPPEPPSSAETQPPQSETEAADDLSAAIASLERGEGQRAHAMLVRLRERAPDSEVVRRLLRQIDAPVEELLPGPYRQVEVAPGDSLSLIASRELGDPLLFYALARLNGIDAPARLPAGTWLRIPAFESGRPDAAAAGVSVAEIESVAAYLARSGQVEQARRMLIDRLARDDRPLQSTQRRLVDITLEEIAGADATGEADRALTLVDEALSVVDAPTSRARLVQAHSKLRAGELYRLALEIRERGDLETAYARAAEAVVLDPASSEAGLLAESLKEEVVESLHGGALVAWRNRDVDLAIRNWESLLEIDPDFEPARIYLDRARSLRLRLDEP